MANTTIKPVAAAIGACMVGTLSLTTANAAPNPFGLEELNGGYMQVADAKAGEGKCGEGKCGAGAAGAADTEGKCGGDKGMDEGKCGGDKGKKEGKCGEGKCGAG